MYRLCLRVTEKEKEAFLIQGDLGFAWDTGPWPAAWSQPPAFSSENMPLGIWGSLPENALCPKSNDSLGARRFPKWAVRSEWVFIPGPSGKRLGVTHSWNPGTEQAFSILFS